MVAETTGAGAGTPPAPDPFERADPPLMALTLWPHRSLTRRGATGILALVAGGLAMPLLMLHGSAVGWGMLPFMVAALLALDWGLRRNEFDGRITEELRLWPDLITVTRREPRGTVRRWHANPFWVQARIVENARIEKYLTLKGNGREIELGAFLSPWERETLHRDLTAALVRLHALGPEESL